jgi:hypothetical protein
MCVILVPLPPAKTVKLKLSQLIQLNGNNNNNNNHHQLSLGVNNDRLCGLVVRVPGYRSRGVGSVPGVTRFSEK